MRLRLPPWLGLLALALACARIQPPPGGEPDRQAPTVRLQQPASGAVSLGTRPRFQLSFSEYMNRASVAAELRLNPDPGTPLKLHWRGRTLVVRPREELPAGRTYTLELGSGALDLAGNSLRAPLQVLFATTGTPDTLRFAAQLSDLADASLAQLWIWPQDSSDWRRQQDPVWRCSPDRDGRALIGGLPAGPLVAMLVEDLNRDGRWDPLLERAAWPDQQPRAEGEQRLHLFRSSTELFRDSLLLKSGSMIDPLRIRFNAVLEPASLGQLDATRRRSAAADSLRLAELVLLDSLGRTVMLAGLRRGEGGGQWLLALAQPADSARHLLLLRNRKDSLNLKAPQLMALPEPLPDRIQGSAWRDGSLVLSGEVPLAAVDSLRAWQRPSDRADSLELVPAQSDPFTVRIDPVPGGGSLYLPGGLVQSAAGSWPDTLRRLPVAPVPAQAEGGLQWRMDRMPSSAGWRIELRSPGGLHDLPLELEGEADGLAAGLLTFSCYLDRNLNGRWDAGQVATRTWAEPWLALEDSVELIEGWIQGGVLLHLPELIP